MGLLKGIFIFLIAYYSIRLILRLLAPFLIKSFISKAYRNQKPFENRKQEGEVTIEKNKTTQNSSKSNVGEYVDFEEIDDK
ncbi:MAG: DUF4834 domain-containing protein [Flavobacteriales bacterium]